MEQIIEKLEEIKEELVSLFEKSDIEHKPYLIGDIIVVLEDRIFELNRIEKGGVFYKNKPLPGLVPTDYFRKENEKIE